MNIEKEFEEILRVCTRARTKENKELIRKAFDLANEAHAAMRRRSGEPYIIHPIEVAKIVAGEIGLGTKSVVSALLHDVVEDTEYTLEDIERLFGDKIASIIDGLTKISLVFDEGSSLQAENFRKMLMTLSDDVRVILIKLADRLHNMRTLESLPQHKQMKIASETLFLYAPLAHRLGLYAIKTELEDLSLKHQHPLIYNDILQKVRDSEKKRLSYINKFTLPIINQLNEAGIKYSVTVRPKSIFSIWNKMQVKNVPFEEIYDIFAIRIIFDPQPKIPEKTQCWNIYSIITDIYQPNPDRLRDWVSTPKANGYEALHTTVMGPEGRWVEIQIRTHRMDEIAERGYAAHWKYKGEGSEEGELDRWIKRIRELLENPESNALEFLDEFKMNLYSSEIFVFTPKGLLKRLPKGATALDFAYEIHSEVGNLAIGAKVNHRLQPLSFKLKSGDQVEVLTSDKQKPQRDWLDFVITAKAKTNIKDAFKEERKIHLNEGKRILEEKLREQDLAPTSITVRKLMNGYGIRSKDELYINIGSGVIDLDDLRKVLKKKTKNKWIRYWQLQLSKTTRRKKKDDSHSGGALKIDKTKTILLQENMDHDEYKIARCCNPIPGDDVIGYLDVNDTILIHKKKCPNAIKLSSSFGDKIVTAKWTTHKVLSFLARIQLSGIDKIGIVNNVTNIISKELDVNIRSIYFESNDGVFEGEIDIYVHNTDDLDNLIHDLKKITGVNKVTRIEEIDE
ncbi:MAG: bifunctional (p)ppGpp synthetase/guanosine-3',5'-bis(diphosphate) 3'-pyrophosphohydrolase [Bacteroidetes bacterium]|nr:bifunctional (p)ppGpp synthetase/guanosine-3',5'-bis(diphosphate) 3'-pyrophosphohydrolase [Bacteroidota bacterium]